jgi:hypothetical protein
MALGPEWSLSELDCDLNNISVRSFIPTGAPFLYLDSTPVLRRSVELATQSGRSALPQRGNTLEKAYPRPELGPAPGISAIKCTIRWHSAEHLDPLWIVDKLEHRFDFLCTVEQGTKQIGADTKYIGLVVADI